jgi:hypothetical protein
MEPQAFFKDQAMFRNFAFSTRRFVGVLAAAGISLSLVGCGDEVSGIYEGSGGDKIEFDGSKVYVTMSPAPTLAGEYEIDGTKIILKVAGQSLVLTRNGDTLEGGPFGQTYTKAGKNESKRGGTSNDASGSAEGLYVVNIGQESMSIKLEPGGRAVLTINEGGAPEITEGLYRVNRDTVSITMNGETNDFRLIGDALEGGIGGMTLRFAKQ